MPELLVIVIALVWLAHLLATLRLQRTTRRTVQALIAALEEIDDRERARALRLHGVQLELLSIVQTLRPLGREQRN